MDINELGAIGELVGGVAVIASLIYVGLQVRQSNNLARGAAELEVGRMNMEYTRLGAEGDYATIYSRAVIEPENVSHGERQRAIWALGMWFHTAQAFRQFRRGLLGPESWYPMANTLVEALDGDQRNALTLEVWEPNGWYIAADFRRYIENLRSRRSRGESVTGTESIDFSLYRRDSSGEA